MNRIGELMEKFGTKQEEIAYLCKVRQSTVSAWVTGRATPNIESMVTLCHRFNVSLDYLMGVDNIVDDTVPELDQYIRGELTGLTNEQKEDVLKYIR